MCENEFDDELESPNSDYIGICPECCYYMDQDEWEARQALKWDSLRN